MSNLKSQFLLDPEITYLNHGSFGACPKPIFENYQNWQRLLEREPVQFILNDSWRFLQRSKEALAHYINCDAQDFYFTTNPTTAMNTVMRSLKLKDGDEILATDQEYGALDKMWKFYSKNTGVKYVQQHISLPVVSREQIIAEFWQGYNSNTKAVFINQISSATALIFPVQEICERARELGLITIIDGAHVPGHIELDIKKLNPDFYTGTLHKWMLAPKGCSFLYVAKNRQDLLDPLVVSWGYDNEMNHNDFLAYHEQQGTRDISAFLTAPSAIQFLNDNNWSEIGKKCRQLILDNYERFCDLLQTKPICPISEDFIAQMCSIPIKTSDPIRLKELLFKKYKIEIPIMDVNGKFYIRISIQAYNSQQDLDVLFSAISDIQATTDLLG